MNLKHHPVEKDSSLDVSQFLVIAETGTFKIVREYWGHTIMTYCMIFLP